MTSRLETVPRDVLQHIAFLCGSSSVFEPPIEISGLLRTSSAIYQSINVADTPDLYAHIFRTKFDTQSSIRRYQKRMIDSAFAAELLSRFRVLQRSSRLDFSLESMEQDLWTALWMFLESDGLNEEQLSTVAFADYILCLARRKLQQNADRYTDAETLSHLIIWLLCLALPRRLILDMSKQDRDEFYSLIFPYIFLKSNETSESLNPTGHNDGIEDFPNPDATGSKDPIQVCTYRKRQRLSVPDPSTAAINLAFVILEATPVKIPYHLPETRAIANASQRSGPTKEDYHSLASYQTPLFADSKPHIIPQCFHTRTKSGRSLQHDVEFGRVLRNLEDADVGGSDAFNYIPGTLTGLWEGVYRTVDSPNRNPSSAILLNPLLSVVMMKPMQCVLVEYICSDSEPPPGVLKDGLVDADICSSDFFSAKDRCELLVRGKRYHKYLPPTRTVEYIPEALKPVHGVIILGETSDDHDQAWGGFKFCGQVHNDGRVLLKREPKDTSGDQGLWIFEGRLRGGVVILGRWRMTGNPNTFDHGIFSLGKTLKK